MKRQTLLTIATIAVLAPLVVLLQAQTAPAPIAAAAPGIKLQVEPLHDPARADARVVRMIALAVPEGAPASGLAPPGRFRATFDGFLNLRIRGDYTFSAHGRGEVAVLVNDKLVLNAAGEDLSSAIGERVRLKKGANTVRVTYTSPPSGPATLRLWWAEKDKPAQPISPALLTHNPQDVLLLTSLQLRAGREIVAQLRCVKCHTTPTAGMPELQTDAPSLKDVGDRLHQGWMAKWIHDPSSLRADASMPRVLADDSRPATDALDIAAYLATLRSGAPAEVRFTDDERIAGARLFADLGCLTCHTTGAQPADDRLPLGAMKSKWIADALVEYLLAPQRHFPWTRMPDFRLDEREARRLAAYIVSLAPEEPSAPDPVGDPARGRDLVATTGCLKCHTLDLPNRTPAAPNLDKLREVKAGCLAEDPLLRRTAPQFSFSTAQREAVRAFVSRSEILTAMNDTPAEFAERQMRQLQCSACHAIDHAPDRLSALEGEVDEITRALPPADEPHGDQSRPSLTWAGEKLRTDWTAKFIGGEIDYKPRPWLATRMPAFPSRAKLLAEGMAQQHGIMHEPDDDARIDEALSAVGRKLVGKEKGFACNTCHAIGAADATSPFEAHGPNFIYTTDRYRKEFYHRWVGDPQRYEPGTRMPQYSDSEGKTAFKDVFEGNAKRQFEAIWHYLHQRERMTPPEQ